MIKITTLDICKIPMNSETSAYELCKKELDHKDHELAVKLFKGEEL